MDEPKWRGTEERKDGRREYIREKLPSGKCGFIADDLDLIIRYWGPEHQTDGEGRIRLVEFKVGFGQFGYSQRLTLGLLDRMCKTSDYADRYEGFFLIYSESENWHDVDKISVNGWHLSHEEFNEWILNKRHIDPVEPQFVPKEVSKWHK